MGWSSANGIFNPVARSLQEAGVDDATKRKVLGDLIGGLQDGDWDTEDESLEDFLDDPAIVAAFADRKVHLTDRSCCARELGVDARAVLVKMRHEDVSEQVMSEAVDAFAHQLAQKQRAVIGHLMDRWAPSLHQDAFEELIKVIDPRGQG